MKLYVVSPVIGDGQTFETAYRAAVDDVDGINSNSRVPTSSEGQPMWAFAFSVVGTFNRASVEQVSNSFVLPEYALDGRMDGMESATRTAMNQSLEAYQLSASNTLDMTFYSDSDSYRTVLDGLGKQFDPEFRIDYFDVAEPSE